MFEERKEIGREEIMRRCVRGERGGVVRTRDRIIKFSSWNFTKKLKIDPHLLGAFIAIR